MNIQTIKHVGDCVPLYLPHSLYLKPIAKFNISVALPQAIPGKTISNWDVMEKLRQLIQPDQFSVLKVSKSTLDIIRFEAEIDDREKLRNVLSRLDGRSIKLASFSESVKIRASETKDEFPTRHDWDSFFRDARNMDEMKPGERPDTVHITNLPIRWFCPRHMENDDNVKPSESIFKRIFEKFGEVRCVDIPICDPYRSKMKSHMTGMKTFSHDQELYFEGYIQFSEYISFVRSMDTFRGMKLVRKEGDKNLTVNILVDFDKSKHLSDMSIKRRKIVRDRLVEKDRMAEEEEKKKVREKQEKEEKERRRQEEMKQAEYDKQRQREEKRKEKQLKKLREKEQTEINSKIRDEEKKLLLAQRKLESIRLLEVLFQRIMVKTNQTINSIKVEKNKHSKKDKKKNASSTTASTLQTNDLRNKLVKRFKTVQEQELEKHKERLKKTKEGKTILTKMLHDRSRSLSVNTISSNDSILSDRPTTKGDTKKKKKKKKKKRGNDKSESSTSSSSSEEDAAATDDKPQAMNPMMMAAQGFPVQPVYNPETGEWVGMGMGMGMYPYPQFFPGNPMIRPGFFPGYRGGYRGRGNPRFPRPPRGRGGYRGRGSYNNTYEYDANHRPYYDKNKGGYDEEYDEHDRRSRSRSKSYSRSRNRRSRSRSHSRRSRSRSRRSHSSRSRSKSKKLVSTLRRSRSTSQSRSRSKSRSRSRLRHSSDSSGRWSSPPDRKRRKSRSSWSRSKSRSRSISRSRSRPKNHDVVLEPEKLVRTAKEIQRSVQKKLHDRMREEEDFAKNKRHFDAEELDREREMYEKREAEELINNLQDKSNTPPQPAHTSASICDATADRQNSRSTSRSKHSPFDDQSPRRRQRRSSSKQNDGSRSRTSDEDDK